LKSPIPDDLVPILAKDHQKQLAIRRKDEDSARVDEQKLNNEKQGKMPTLTATKNNFSGHLDQQYQYLQAEQDSLRSQLAAQQQSYQLYSGGFHYDPITARPQFGNPLERTVQNSLPQTTSSHATLQMPQKKPPHPDLLKAYRAYAIQLDINAKSPDLDDPVPSFNGHQAEEFEDWSYAPRSPLHQHENFSGSSNSQRLPSAPPTETTPQTQVASNSADRRSNSFESPRAEQSQTSGFPPAHEVAMLQIEDNDLSQANHTGRVAPASWAELVRAKQS
jgi:hypothetical protein